MGGLLERPLAPSLPEDDQSVPRWEPPKKEALNAKYRGLGMGAGERETRVHCRSEKGVKLQEYD